VRSRDSSHDGHAASTARQGLSSSKSHLEGMGPGFTSPGGRILTSYLVIGVFLLSSFSSIQLISKEGASYSSHTRVANN
jgi:hypothetical protein